MQPTDWIGAVGAIAAMGALILAARANSRSSEANRIARNALERESLIDERQREFRAVEWDARVLDDQKNGSMLFELSNVGDTDARDVTVVLHLSSERETHTLGDIPAKGTATVTSDSFADWMREAREHDIVHPGFRLHWSSPLGQVSDEKVGGRTVDDFIVWGEEEY